MTITNLQNDTAHYQWTNVLGETEKDRKGNSNIIYKRKSGNIIYKIKI